MKKERDRDRSLAAGELVRLVEELVLYSPQEGGLRANVLAACRQEQQQA